MRPDFHQTRTPSLQGAPGSARRKVSRQLAPGKPGQPPDAVPNFGRVRSYGCGSEQQRTPNIHANFKLARQSKGKPASRAISRRQRCSVEIPRIAETTRSNHDTTSPGILGATSGNRGPPSPDSVLAFAVPIDFPTPSIQRRRESMLQCTRDRRRIVGTANCSAHSDARCTSFKERTEIL